MPAPAAKQPLTAAQRRIYDAATRLFAERGVTAVNVSDLAEAAGVARGTIYNNGVSIESLFTEVAAHLADEMNRRVAASFEEVEDPALRIALGIRHYLRRAHEEPDWGRFIARFGLTPEMMQKLWSGPPTRDLMAGLDAGRFKFRLEQLPSAIAMIGGSVMSSLFLVLHGHQTWREAGSHCAELVLRGLGITPKQAAQLARAELPPLPKLPD